MNWFYNKKSKEIFCKNVGLDENLSLDKDEVPLIVFPTYLKFVPQRENRKTNVLLGEIWQRAYKELVSANKIFYHWVFFSRN